MRDQGRCTSGHYKEELPSAILPHLTSLLWRWQGTDVYCSGPCVRKTEIRDLLTWGKWTSLRASISGPLNFCDSRDIQQERLTNGPAFEGSQSPVLKPVWLLLCSRWKWYPRTPTVQEPNFTRFTSWKVSWRKICHFLLKERERWKNKMVSVLLHSLCRQKILSTQK